MNAFGIDQHISVVGDLKNVWGELGHTITDVCMSGHAEIMGRRRQHIPMLSGDAWCGLDERNDWDKFYNLYHPQLEQFDAFLACYPPIFAMLYQRFGKPVVIDIPIRYEYGTSTAERWQRWNDWLLKGVSDGMVHLVANSLYDKLYTEAFLGVRCVQHIPSLCAYTDAPYTPTDDRVLYYATAKIPGLPETFVRKHDVLAFGHPWTDVSAFKCIVHFPYNVSTMSIFEHYTANIPLLFPTRRFLVEMFKSGYPVLEQASWNATYHKPPGSLLKPHCEFDPNDYTDLDGMAYWLQFADYYNAEWMANIQYFDNLAELESMVKTIDFAQISERMKAENVMRRALVLDNWGKVLGKIRQR